jgi:hypothetical protein
VFDSCDPDPLLNLRCVTPPGLNMTGTCRAPGKLGDDCTNIECDTGLYCNRTGGTNVCAALPTLNQSCLNSNFECLKPYFCNSQKNYICDQPAPLGGDCTQVTCDIGLWCDRTAVPNNTCKAQLPDGSVCTQSIECLSQDCGGGGPGQSTCQPRTLGPQCTGR